jgi:hypothetical protein
MGKIFGDLTYGNHVNTYAGAPVEELKALQQTASTAYQTNKQNYDLLDIAAANMDVHPLDDGIKNKAIQQLKDTTKEVSASGNYETSKYIIAKAAKDMAVDPVVNTAIKNKKAYDDANKLQDEMQAKGIPVLRFDTYTGALNPDGSLNNGYKPDVRQQLDYDKQKESLFNDLTADGGYLDLGHPPVGEQGVEQWKGIARNKVDNYIDKMGGWQRYKASPEYAQEYEKLVRINKVPPDKADQIIRTTLKATGYEKVFGVTGVDYRSDEMFKYAMMASRGKSDGTQFVQSETQPTNETTNSYIVDGLKGTPLYNPDNSDSMRKAGLAAAGVQTGSGKTDVDWSLHKQQKADYINKIKESNPELKSADQPTIEKAVSEARTNSMKVAFTGYSFAGMNTAELSKTIANSLQGSKFALTDQETDGTLKDAAKKLDMTEGELKEYLTSGDHRVSDILPVSPIGTGTYRYNVVGKDGREHELLISGKNTQQSAYYESGKAFQLEQKGETGTVAYQSAERDETGTKSLLKAATTTLEKQNGTWVFNTQIRDAKHFTDKDIAAQKLGNESKEETISRLKASGTKIEKDENGKYLILNPNKVETPQDVMKKEDSAYKNSPLMRQYRMASSDDPYVVNGIDDWMNKSSYTNPSKNFYDSH